MAGSPGGFEAGRANLRVLPDTSHFGPKLQAFIDKVEKMTTFELDVSINHHSLEKIRKQLKDLEDDVDTVDVPVDVDTKAAQWRLARLARDRVVKLLPEVSTAAAAKAAAYLKGLSGFGAIEGYASSFNDFLLNLDKSIPRLMMLSTSIASVSASALSGVGNIVGFTASLTPLFTGSLAAAPAILGATAIGVGSLIAVLKDGKKRLGDLAGGFHQLQDAMSAKFWAQAEAPIRRLVGTLLPQMKTGLVGVSGALGRYTKIAADAFRIEGPKVLPQLFAAVRDAIDGATRGLEPMIAGLSRVTEVGARYLPAMGNWLADISTRWGTWMQQASASGVIANVIEGAAAGFHDLGQILKNTGGIISDVLVPAMDNSGAALSTFADMLARVRDVTSSDVFQVGLGSFFEGAKLGSEGLSKGIADVIRLLGTLGPQFGIVMQIAGRALGGFLSEAASALDRAHIGDALVGMFSGFSDGIAGLKPALKPLADLLYELADTAGSAAASLGGALGKAISALAPQAAKILDALDPLIRLLSDTLAGAVEAVAPLIGDLGQALADAFNNSDLVGSVGGLIQALAPLIQSVIPLLAAYLPRLFDFWAKNVDAITEFVKIITPLFQFLGDNADVFGPLLDAGVQMAVLLNPLIGLVNALKLLVQGFQWVWNKAADFVGFVKSDVIPWFERLAGVIVEFKDNAIGKLSDAWDGVKSAWNSVGSFFTETVPGWFSSLGSGIEGTAQGNIDRLSGLWDGVKSAWESVGTFFTETVPGWFVGLTQKAMGALGSLGDMLSPILDPLKDMFGSVFRGIVDQAKIFLSAGFLTIVEGLQGNFDKIPEIATAAIEKTKANLIGVFSSIAGGLQSIGATIVATVAGWIGAAVGVIMAGWETAKNWTTVKFIEISSAVGAGLGKALAWARSLPSQAANAITAGWERAKAATVSAMIKLASSVASGIGNAIAYLRAFPSRAAGAVGSLIGTLERAGQDLVQGMINGVTKKASQLINKVKSMASDAANAARNVLGIHSPSRVFAEIGRFTGQGFIDGLAQVAPRVATATADMISIPSAIPASLALAGGASPAGGSAIRGGVTVEHLVVNEAQSGIAQIGAELDWYARKV